MGVEMFGLRHCHDMRRIGTQTARVILHDAGALEELIHAHAAGESRGGVGREAVARPGDVIAGGHGRPGAHEDRAGMSQLFQDGGVVARLEACLLYTSRCV